MNQADVQFGAGWRISQSVALELDFALTVVNGYFPLGELSPDLAGLGQAVPDDARSDWEGLWDRPASQISLLETLAILAGVLLDDSYSRTTIALRELDLAAALAAVEPRAEAVGLAPDPALPPAECLVDLATRWRASAFAELGLPVEEQTRQARRLRQEAVDVLPFLAGGLRHARFWHWLDRYYYEVYRPWRAAREEPVRRSEADAALVLGGTARAAGVPPLDWLPPQNPLLRQTELRREVEAGRLQVAFWVEPFGLADTWTLLPGLVILSFAQPGALFEHFRAITIDLAGRAAALGDPTRLIILRLIRHFGQVNTEIAEYLKLSRPTVSIHARILREAGLIRSHREGRLMRHEIVPAEVRRLFRDLEHFLELPPDDQ